MNAQKKANMTAKLSVEEKAIIAYVESGFAISIDKVGKEKNVTHKLHALK
jgi:hypothetical protein